MAEIFSCVNGIFRFFGLYRACVERVRQYKIIKIAELCESHERAAQGVARSSDPVKHRIDLSMSSF